jgi:hypothetical protein
VARSTGGVRWGRGIPILMLALVLVATGCSKNRNDAAAGSGVRAYDIIAQKFRYSGIPASIASGNIQFNFSNHETFPIVHEMIVAQLPTGKTADDIIASAKVKGCVGGGECESQYLHFGEIDDVSTGATLSGVFNLPAGSYSFACWQQGTPEGKEDGPPHASIGMVQTFTVT